MRARSGVTRPGPMNGDDVEVIWRCICTVVAMDRYRVTLRCKNGVQWRVRKEKLKQYGRNNHYWLVEPEDLENE